METTKTIVNKRKLVDREAPNRSTWILNGRNSNILNWDDVRYPWAYPKYKVMLSNFWTPFEINMMNDAKQFPQLTEIEQESFLKIIGLLALLDSIQSDYASKVADYLTDSSLNALMIMLAQQEVIHNHSYLFQLYFVRVIRLPLGKTVKHTENRHAFELQGKIILLKVRKIFFVIYIAQFCNFPPIRMSAERY